MLDINFKIGRKKYLLKSSTYDFILSEVVKSKSKDNEDIEVEKKIGYFADLGYVLSYIPNHHLRNVSSATNTDLESLSELHNELKTVMEDIKKASSQIIAECYMSPEEANKQKIKIEKLEKMVKSKKE